LDEPEEAHQESMRNHERQGVGRQHLSRLAVQQAAPDGLACQKDEWVILYGAARDISGSINQTGNHLRTNIRLFRQTEPRHLGGAPRLKGLAKQMCLVI
tara:strand:+ start:167 stop:463 length:297 start_codon:yes stop_codon:yes gene_type:complete